MADRYWVGGTGAWNAVNTANWSASSGGAGGASVPTAADNVFFNSASSAGTYTCTFTGGSCLSISISGPASGTLTLTGSTNVLNISANFFVAATGVTLTGINWTFVATTVGNTITSNGKILNQVTFTGGAAATWILQDAISTGSFQQIQINSGTLDTNGFNYTAQSITLVNATAGILCRGSTLTAGSVTLVTAGATFNAGTSQINLTSYSISSPTSIAFNNVTFTTAALTGTISGNHTFVNLTVSARATVGVSTMLLAGNQTITGTLALNSGVLPVYRTYISTNIPGTQRTLTCATITGGADYDFKNITIAGAASPISPARAGDCGGNSGITFPAAKTVYYRQTGSANWGATGSGSWSATSGGALDVAMFPLAQDTAIFPAATYPASGSTTTINGDYNIGVMDMSLRTTNTMTLAIPTSTPTAHGNWINGTGITFSGTGGIMFASTTTQQVTSAGRAFTQTITVNNGTGTTQLQDAFSCATLTLTTGTLALQSYTLTASTAFNTVNQNIRTIAFGTGNITCTGTGTVWNLLETNLSTTGTQVVNVTSTGSTAITVSSGALSEANSISFNFTGGTYALSFLIGSASTARSVNFTGFAGSWGALPFTAPIIYGNLIISAGMTVNASTNPLAFSGTGATQQITTNGKTLDFLITFSGTSTKQLQDALTVGSTKTVTLSSGTLDLQSYTLSTGLFNSSNSAARTIAFGTGNITCTGTGTVWTTSTVTNLTTTGTQVVNVTSSGSTAITVTPGPLSEANSISYNFTGGTYALTFLSTSSHTARSVNFTGYAGTWGTIGIGGVVIFGNLTLSTGMTITASTRVCSFAATSGTQNITTNGKLVAFALNFNGTGGTRRLQDALTTTTTNATLTNGTLDLNGKTMTVVSFITSTGTKNLTFNGGTLVCTTATTTAFNNAAPTGFTTTAGTGTGTITLTAALAKTFVGGGSTYNCTLNQGGIGALTVSGSNTFLDITNTVQPASVLFTAGTTNTFSNFSLSGTAGNLITIGSNVSAIHTLSKTTGTVSVSYCSISYSTATGGATWNALNSTNGGNNTGWVFGSVAGATGNFFLLF